MMLLALPLATDMGELIVNTGGSFTGVTVRVTVALVLVLDGEGSRLSVAVTLKLDWEYWATRVPLPSVGSTVLL